MRRVVPPRCPASALSRLAVAPFGAGCFLILPDKRLAFRTRVRQEIPKLLVDRPSWQPDDPGLGVIG
jgi:hypothetical protein